jgi:hypothetical protein
MKDRVEIEIFCLEGSVKDHRFLIQYFLSFEEANEAWIREEQKYTDPMVKFEVYASPLLTTKQDLLDKLNEV